MEILTVGVLVFLAFPAGVTKLGITKFEAKIGQENKASISMFRKLHFKEVTACFVLRQLFPMKQHFFFE